MELPPYLPRFWKIPRIPVGMTLGLVHALAMLYVRTYTSRLTVQWEEVGGGGEVQAAVGRRWKHWQRCEEMGRARVRHS